VCIDLGLTEIAPVESPEQIVDFGKRVETAVLRDQSEDGQQIGAVGGTVALAFPVTERGLGNQTITVV